MRSYLALPLLLTLVGSFCYFSVQGDQNEEPKFQSLLRRRLTGVYGSVYGVPQEAPQQQQQPAGEGRRLSNGYNNGYPQQRSRQMQELPSQEQNGGGYGFVLPEDGQKQQQQQQQQQQPRMMQQPQEIGEGGRPPIFTYVEQSAQYDPNDDTADLVENWRKAWYDVGWDPRVLDARDALRLPEYQELMSLITEPTLIDEKAIVNYKRWIAMVSVGGGWMADINTWPMNYFIRHGRMLPNDGALTIYQGYSPSLVSGTGDEFLRITRQIGKTAEKTITKQKLTNEHFPEKYSEHVEWNDLIGLKELKHKSPDMFKTKGDVVPKNKLFRDGLMQCEESESKRALYLGDLKATKESTRGTIARKFLNDWRENCQMTTVEDIEAPKKSLY